MASKFIEWDEVLVTRDPKKKEVGVTFVKVDGFGSPGGAPGTDEDSNGDGPAGPPVTGDNEECLAHDCNAYTETDLGGLLVGFVQGAPLWNQTTTADGYGTYYELVSPNNGTVTGMASQQPYWGSSPFSYEDLYYWSHVNPANGGAGIICGELDLYGPIWSGTQSQAFCPPAVLELTNNLEDHFWPESNTLLSEASPLDPSVYPYVGENDELNSEFLFTETIVLSPEGANAPGPTSKCASILCRANPLVFNWRADFNEAGTYALGGGFNWAEGDIQLFFYGDGRITCKKRTPSNTVSSASTISEELGVGSWDPNAVGEPIVVTMSYTQKTNLKQTSRTGEFRMGVSISQGGKGGSVAHQYECSNTAPDYSGSNGVVFAFPSYKAMTPATGIGWTPTQARCGLVHTSAGAEAGGFSMRVLAAVGGNFAEGTDALDKLLRSFTTYQTPTYCERIP